MLIKRAFDLVAALVALVVLSPILCAVAVVVLVAMGRPVLFRQVRPGRYGEPFVIYKFRTMRPPLRPGAELYDDEQRLTWLGRLLRSASLDELPQLVNVVRGEMSLVGPRPLLAWEAERFRPGGMARSETRPGLAGPW